MCRGESQQNHGGCYRRRLSFGLTVPAEWQGVSGFDARSRRPWAHAQATPLKGLRFESFEEAQSVSRPMGGAHCVGPSPLTPQLRVRRIGTALMSLFALLCGCGVPHPQRMHDPQGIAAQYPGDRGIQSDPAVIYFGTFESDSWYLDWGTSTKPANADVVHTDASRLFVPLEGKALRIRIEQGSNAGIGATFQFMRHIGEEPDDIYFRYYLRFADDWHPLIDGGKLPGPAGTYDRAGWGGRRSDGTNGWSARGHFGIQASRLTPIGFYVYHADQPTQYGDIWVWDKRNLGHLLNNRWYCVEHHVKLNTPTRRDGVLRAWIDGQLAFAKADVRFRDLETLKIETIWLNVYHGGTAVAASDHHLYIDNVVIARSYIGPMKARESSASTLRASPGNPFARLRSRG